MMKKNYLLIILLLGSLFTYAQHANDIEGIWYLHADDKGRIPIAKIFAKNGQFYMYPFGYQNSKDLLYDTKNPNPQLRSMVVKGMVILYGLKFDDGEWTGGKIYKPDDGKTYYATIKLSKDKNTITIKGSLDKYGFLGQTFQWTRVPPNLYQALPDNEIRNPWGY